MVHVKIIGAGHYLPERIVGNDEFAGRTVYTYHRDGTKDNPKVLTAEGIIENNGILERRYMASDEDAPSLGVRAARMAMDRAGITPADLDVIVVATESSRRFPSSAATIQSRLAGARCACLDVGAACAGFPVAVYDAISRLERGHYGLAIATSGLSRKATFDDINSTLFGDGSGAVVLYREKDDDGRMPVCHDRKAWIFTGLGLESGVYGIYHETNTDDGRIGYIEEADDRWVRMNEGRKVFSDAVEGMVEATITLKQLVGWQEAKLYIPHQANLRILDRVRKRLGVSEEQLYINIQRYGNMSAATCAVALSETLENGRIKKGDKVVLSAAGAGINVSGLAMIV